MRIIKPQCGKIIIAKEGNVTLVDLDQFQGEGVERSRDVTRCHNQGGGNAGLSMLAPMFGQAT